MSPRIRVLAVVAAALVTAAPAQAVTRLPGTIAITCADGSLGQSALVLCPIPRPGP